MNHKDAAGPVNNTQPPTLTPEMSAERIAERIDEIWYSDPSSAGENLQQNAPLHHHLTRGSVETFCDSYLSLCLPPLRLENQTGASLLGHVTCFLERSLTLEITKESSQTNELKDGSVLIELTKEARQDCEAVFRSDPSVTSFDTVCLSYPGPKALTLYRLAHKLWLAGAKITARSISELAHERTGIDIHPGASLGSYIAIDHGTGIVIGETAVVGSNVRMYHGVTLGNLNVAKTQAGNKRHPTIGDDCTVYALATILGGETVIEKGSVVGGGVWITKSPPHGSQNFDKNR